MSSEVMFYVQHLLGIGHVMRVAAIVREMTRRGVSVTMVSGGEPVKVLDLGGADLIQLPPAKAMDKTFKPLYDENSRPIDDAWRENRRNRLMEVFKELRPRVLAVEMFPFGRRQFRFELEPLLEAAKAARPRPQIVCSVRDILVEKKKPGRNLEMVELAQAHFDVILAHGDAKFIPFSATFPLAGRLGGKLRYSGYVVDKGRAAPKGAPGAAAKGKGPGEGEVIVSAGGAGELLNAALKARPLSALKDSRWRLLAGHSLPEDRFQELTAAAFRASESQESAGGFAVERARPDFQTLLANCALSISQGGYNTVMEIIAAKAKSVIVPYAGGEENEQTLRARLLEERGLTRVLDEDALTPENLAAAVNSALKAPPFPDVPPFDANGAALSAEIIAGLAKKELKSQN